MRIVVWQGQVCQVVIYVSGTGSDTKTQLYIREYFKCIYIYIHKLIMQDGKEHPCIRENFLEEVKHNALKHAEQMYKEKLLEEQTEQKIQEKQFVGCMKDEANWGYDTTGYYQLFCPTTVQLSRETMMCLVKNYTKQEITYFEVLTNLSNLYRFCIRIKFEKTPPPSNN